MEHNFKIPHQPRYNGEPFTYSPECRKCRLWLKWDSFITMVGGLLLLSFIVAFPLWIGLIVWLVSLTH